jgi:hypothetical protein
VREITYAEGTTGTIVPAAWPAADVYAHLAVLAVFAVVFFVLAARMLPRTD